MYATSIRYLNDREEFNHGIGIAEQILQDITNGLGDDDSLKEFLPEILKGFFEDGVLSPKKLNIFTASFTVNGDQLSQWRGYSNGSSGVSLGFDLRSFRPAPDLGTMVQFAPCVYQDGAKFELMREAISGFVDAAQALSKRVIDKDQVRASIEETMRSHPEMSFVEAARLSQEMLASQIVREINEAASGMAADLLRLAGLLKHHSFEEEKEWRFVLPVTLSRLPTQNPIKYRHRTNTLIPYQEFPLSAQHGDNIVLPLTDVILGPGSEETTAIDAARAFLESEGVRNVDLRYSEIPYRPW